MAHPALCAEGRSRPPLLDDDLRPGRSPRRHLLPQPAGDLLVGLGFLGLRPRGDDGGAGIGQFPDRDLERQFAQELHADALRFRLGAAMYSMDIAERVLLLGSGRFSLWQGDDHWVRRHDGAA